MSETSPTVPSLYSLSAPLADWSLLPDLIADRLYEANHRVRFAASLGDIRKIPPSITEFSPTEPVYFQDCPLVLVEDYVGYIVQDINEGRDRVPLRLVPRDRFRNFKGFLELNIFYQLVIDTFAQTHPDCRVYISGTRAGLSEWTTRRMLFIELHKKRRSKYPVATSD